MSVKGLAPLQVKACSLSAAMSADSAAALSEAIAVGLMSAAVTWQLGLALRMGSTLEPQPHPSSRMWRGGLPRRQGNSSSKYLAAHKTLKTVQRHRSMTLTYALARRCQVWVERQAWQACLRSL